MQQRMIETRRTEGKRRLKVLIAMVTVLCLTGGAFLAMRSPFLDVDRLQILSGPHTPAQEITAAAGVPKHRALVDVDTGAVARRIRTLPWVRSVRVTKKWPATVRIEVVERVPAAAVPAAAGGWALVDRFGRVLARVGAAPPDVPPVVDVAPVGGPGTNVWASVRPSLAVAGALPRALVPRVAGVGPGEDGEVQLHLKPSGVARLGTPTDLAAKLSALVVVLDHVPMVTGAGVALVDVRVPTTPVVTRSLTPSSTGR